MIRVVHIISSLMTGGAELMLARLAAATDRRRFRPVILSLTGAQGGAAGEAARLGVEVHCCRMRRPIPDPAGLLRFLLLVRRMRPDILQGWMYHGNLAALAASAILPPRIPVLWNVRGSHHRLGEERPATAAAIWLSAKLSRRPDRIINNSRESAGLHERELGFARGKWELIPNGFDLGRFQPDPRARAEVRAELGIPENAPLAGIVGRYHPMKDHINFLQAAAIAAAAEPGLRFLMAGPGLEPENASLAGRLRGLALEGRVHLLGERRDMPRLYAALDLAASASWAEGFPNAVGEAMSCGVPCVVTDAGDSRWLVGETGLVVAPRDPRALARAWLDMLRAGPEVRAALGREARRRIASHFSLESVVARYEALYEEVLRASGGKGAAECAA